MARKLKLLEDLGVDGRTVLKCILRAVEWKDVNWIHIPLDRDKFADPCEHGHKHSDSTKCTECLD